VKNIRLFPVTVVGSWPRPRWLLDALRAKRSNKISDEDFRSIADEAVLLAVKYQEDAGVDILTDGEQRRDNFYSFIADKIDGIELKSIADIIDLIPDKLRFENILRALDVPAYAIRNPIVVSKLRMRREGIAVDEVEFLKRHTHRLIKVPLPGPYLLTRSSWVPGITDKHYSSREALADEYAKLLRNEILSLKNLGVHFVQLDEPVLMEILYGSDASQQTFMCAALFSRSNPRDELEFAVDVINKVVKGISDVKLGVHVCRGNWSKKEESLLKGDYYALMPYLAEIKVHQLVLEYATPRAGDIDALKEYLGDKEVGLGVVNPRTDDVEKPEQIVAKVEKVLKFTDPSKIYLNPDCGFGTFAEVPVNTSRIAFEKLRSIKIAADKLREEYGEK
jgi:5-methyltetrahydropteroyltriglutamate--homocysteine methyltransferase